MKVSSIANKIQSSLSRQLFDKAKNYTNVIDLTLGDPDYPTPIDVCEAGCRAIHEGKTKYTANAGLMELRTIVARKVKEDTGLDYLPENVIITVGAMGALYLVTKSYINVGDEVIVPSLCWLNYSQMTRMSGGIPIVMEGEYKDGVSFSAEMLERAVTSRTRMIIINSPCNPTGEIYSHSTLEAIAKIAIKHNLLVLSDEVYSSIVYDGARFESILNIEGMKERTVLVDSCSKRYAMTGWRVGYAVGDVDVIKAMTRLQENVISCCSQPSQYAAIQALSGSQESVVRMVDGYQRRRDMLESGINKIPHLSCRKPQSTFYAFVNISQTGMDSVEFANRLLETVQVAVVPGIAYGNAGKDYIRIAFTRNEEVLKEALERIGRFVSNNTKTNESYI